MSSTIDSLKATLGDKSVETILQSKILVVGAGGIGCEIIKNLAVTGFRQVHVIDLDTIDVSNLNRQLLFRSRHVGQPKCVVACQVAKEMNGDCNFVAHHGNICDNTVFHVNFIQSFDVILSALDNVTARRRVNRLAIAANVPLVEAGTTGYLGQVNTIHKESQTACYECNTVERPKVYPICTIRSTPTTPVHCIVWAKELYKLLFGKCKDSMLYEGGDDEEEDSPDKDEATMEPSIYMEAVQKYRDDKSETVRSNAVDLLKKLYVDEIQKQIGMDRYKTAQKKPSLLNDSVFQDIGTAPTTLETYSQTDIWQDKQCVAEAVQCMVDAKSEPSMLAEFDKDDDICMRFVTAVSNLRMQTFQITPLQSYYSCKGIAGNIIPAIATTNAIVAGLQILQCFLILQNNKTNLKEHCRYMNVARNYTTSGLYITGCTLDDPNPNCFVCKRASITVTLNVHEWDLQSFVSRILKAHLGFEAPSIMIDSDYIWEEGEDADTESFAVNLTKKLPDLPCGGIQNCTMISVEDFTQDLTVELTISHKGMWDDGQPVSDEPRFEVGGSKPVAKVDVATANDSATEDSKPPAVATAPAKEEEEGDDDSFCLVVDPPATNGDHKRAATNGGSPDPPKKRQKIIVIDDDE